MPPTEKVSPEDRTKFKEIAKQHMTNNVDIRLVSIAQNLKNYRIDEAVDEFSVLIREIKLLSNSINIVET